MAKAVHNDVLDAALLYIRSAATRLVALAAEPADYAAANAGALANAVIAPADFTIGDGVTSGRRAVVAAKAGVAVGASGTATHVALLDAANTKLLYVTTCPAQALAAGGTVSIAAWDVEISDPA
jgi:hypothetical protein